MNSEARTTADGNGEELKPSSDRLLVQKCLRGDEDAWATLVNKYKNLVFSIAVRKGLGQEEAADVFQAVWVQVYSKLSSLRKEGSVRSWLISITIHECYHLQQKLRKKSLRETPGVEMVDSDSRFSVDPVDIAEQEEWLLVQQSIAQLTPRCQELIRLLFYSHPPLPYREVAAKLGLAIGSIGFIRGRCLKKLHKALESQGIG